MLPSVLTLLGFSASGVVTTDTGAQGVMGLPFGMLGGASDPTSPPPPPPPTGDPFIHGGSGGKHYRPHSISLEEYFRLTRKKLRKRLREDVEEAIEAAPAPVTKTEAQQITRGLLANVLADVPQTAPPVDAAELRRNIAALRADLLAYAAKVAQQREDDDDEDDAISILLQ